MQCGGRVRSNKGLWSQEGFLTLIPLGRTEKARETCRISKEAARARSNRPRPLSRAVFVDSGSNWQAKTAFQAPLLDADMIDDLFHIHPLLGQTARLVLMMG
jgi:hypothetical protein